MPKPTLFEIHFKQDGKQLFVFFPIGKADEELSLFGTALWDIASGRQCEGRIPPMKTYVFYTGPFPHMLGENTLCCQASEGSGKGMVGIDVASGKEKYNISASTLWARSSPDGKTGADSNGCLWARKAAPLQLDSGTSKMALNSAKWNFRKATSRQSLFSRPIPASSSAPPEQEAEASI